MFEFLSMAYNYEDRKVDRYEQDDVLVSTARVTDSNRPFETAISHPKYNGGDFVIVEKYDTREDAQVGHDKWVNAITSDNLPSELRDASDNGLTSLLDILEDEDYDWRINTKSLDFDIDFLED